MALILLLKGGYKRVFSDIMLWLKNILKDQEGYGVIDFLLTLVGASVLAFLISGRLLDVLRPLHQTAVKNIKGVSSSGL